MKAVKGKEVMPKNKALSVGLLLLAAFALISIVTVEFNPSPAQADGYRAMKRSPEQIVSRLKDRLNLTDEQVKAIEPIIRDNMGKRRELMNEMRQLTQSGDAKIMSILTKEQAVEYQKFRDRRRKMFRSPAGPR